MDILNASKQNQARKIKRIKDLEKNYSLTFVKETRRDNKRDYHFKCPHGHIFKRNAKSANFYCPKCTLKGTSYSEEIVRSIFEEYSGKKFEKIIIKDQVNYFELDGYNKELKIAFEHDGRQHYDLKVFLQMTKKTKKDFLELKRRDKKKDQYCKDNGITLIRIKQLNQDSTIEDVHNICKNLFKKKRQEVKINVNMQTKYLLEVKDKLKKYNCKIVDGIGTLTSSSRVKYKCKKGHLHETTAAKIKHKFKGCPTCNEEKRLKEQLGKIKKVEKRLNLIFNNSEIINRESYVSFTCNNCGKEVNKPLKRFFDDYAQNKKSCKCTNRVAKNKEQIFLKSFNNYLEIKNKKNKTQKDKTYLYKFENKQKSLLKDSKKYLSKETFSKLKKELECPKR